MISVAEAKNTQNIFAESMSYVRIITIYSYSFAVIKNYYYLFTVDICLEHENNYKIVN